jgi:hypothetical protein
MNRRWCHAQGSNPLLSCPSWDTVLLRQIQLHMNWKLNRHRILTKAARVVQFPALQSILPSIIGRDLAYALIDLESGAFRRQIVDTWMQIRLRTEKQTTKISEAGIFPINVTPTCRHASDFCSRPFAGLGKTGRMVEIAVARWYWYRDWRNNSHNNWQISANAGKIRIHVSHGK